MTYEKDEVWGSRTRRTLAFTQPDLHPDTRRHDPATAYTTGAGHACPPAETGPYGPEAVERAQTMAYERMTRIQQESPYIREEVVEHRVHDYRLYIGIWVVAGLSAVSAFLTFDVVHLLITVVAVVFALISSPGRQRYED